MYMEKIGAYQASRKNCELPKGITSHLGDNLTHNSVAKG
jgi:hypothetical protein